METGIGQDVYTISKLIPNNPLEIENEYHDSWTRILAHIHRLQEERDRYKAHCDEFVWLEGTSEGQMYTVKVQELVEAGEGVREMLEARRDDLSSDMCAYHQEGGEYRPGMWDAVEDEISRIGKFIAALAALDPTGDSNESVEVERKGERK
jgi:hypothetical protein